MLWETRDPEEINVFAQHPEIAPEIGGPLDMSGAIRETAKFLIGDHGVFCFEWCAPDTYEIHVMLTHAGRGPWGFRAVQEALKVIAGRGAVHIWARVKPEARHIIFYAFKAGFKDVGMMTLYPGPEQWRIMEWRS